MAMASHAHGNEAQRPLLTVEGRNKLEERLRILKEIERPRIADDIHEAKEAGDVSESSAYEHAKNEQARIEGEIMELEALLRIAGTLELTSGNDTVQIGAKVTVKTESGRERQFTIVSTHEANPAAGYISTESPVGSKLLGRRRDETVAVQTPNGTINYTIVQIH